MSLTFDQYLATASGHAALDFAWDEWRIQDDHADSLTGYEESLAALSDAASLALTIARAEWIVTGLRPHDSDETISQFVQSAWAAFSTRHSPTYFETDDDDWRGPQRGMLNMTLIVVNDAIFCRDEDPDVADRANQLLFYCQLLFSRLPAFKAWLKESLDRLLLAHPHVDGEARANELPVLPPVPRETFGPGVSPAADAAALVEGYLDRVARTNPFLADEEG